GRIIPFISNGAVLTPDGEPIGDSNSNAIVYYDTQPPFVTINQASGQMDPTNNEEIVFAIEFSEPIDPSSFTVSDVDFTGGPIVNGAALVNQGDDQHFLIVTNSITGDGTVMASISAGVVTDLAGNANTASTFTDNQVLLDRDVPAV